MKTLLEIEQYAQKHFVPIARKDFVDFFKKLIIDNNYHEILEIGSAIGYSAIKMALVDDGIKVTTIERDENRYREAVKNIEKSKLNDRIMIERLCDMEWG